MTNINNISRKNKIILIVWVVMIIVSFQARSLLSGGVEESTDLTDSSTESGFGSNLYKERFNISSDTITHIIILELTDNNENFQSNEWRNYTLYLSLYLNESLTELGYSTVISEPLLIMVGVQEEFTSSFVSGDKLYTLIYISGLEDDLDANYFQNDVETIRELLNDPEIVYEYAIKYTNIDGITNLLPDKSKLGSLNLILTGGPANFADIIEVSKESFESSEIISVLIVIIILAIIFRSPLGLLIPIIAMVASLFPTYLATFILSEFGILSITDFLPAIIAMIGIAVAIDYNLFNMVRYREEFRKRRAKHESEGTWNSETIKETEIQASQTMNRTAGTAVMYSGIAVIIGFASLLILGSEFSTGMAIGVSLVVVFSVLTARTLTPAILGLWGRFLDWPNITTRANTDIQNQKENKNIVTFWMKWSNLVMRRPLAFLILGIFIMLPVTFLALDMQLGFDTIKNLPKGTESRNGFEILADKFDLGATSPYNILIDTGKDNGVFDSKIINKTNELARWVMEFEEKRGSKILSFQSINSLSVSTNETSNEITTLSLETIQQILDSPDLIQIGPDDFIPNYQKFLFVENSLKSYVNIVKTNDSLLIKVTSNLDSGSNDAWSLVGKLRSKLAELFDDEIKTYVFGFSASFSDTADSLYGEVPLMLTVAVILLYITLLILFRSILLPIKAIVTIGGSILFSLGSLVFIFQQGNLLWLINAEQIDGITFFIPVFLFTIILGLGMDYSIFIISRIREEYEKGATSHEAVGIGLSKTANVVTSAATVMIVTFLVFAFAPIMFMKTMGLAMAVAILVDATISRMILLPAAMALAGRWNWYLPKFLKKILPEVKLEH